MSWSVGRARARSSCAQVRRAGRGGVEMQGGGPGRCGTERKKRREFWKNRANALVFSQFRRYPTEGMMNGTKLLIVGTLVCAGCAGIFGKAKSPERRVFECEVEAIRPYLADVLDAEELVRDAYAGRANLTTALEWLRVKPADIQAAAEDFKACERPELPVQVIELPEADAGANG